MAVGYQAIYRLTGKMLFDLRTDFMKIAFSDPFF
jgi:hypothetical protein